MLNSGNPMEQALQILSYILGYTILDIKLCLEMLAANKAYAQFQKPKRTGGFRTLNAPAELLKKIQRSLLERIFYQYVIHFAAHGFVRGRSIVTNASIHMNFANHVLNIDLKDAFPSVVPRRVIANVGPQLKRTLKQFTQNDDVREEALKIIVALTIHDEQIPQGAPTSPTLLNIVCYNLDCQIFDYLMQTQTSTGQEFRYTRYADDLTISSNKKIPGSVKQEIRRIIYRTGWKLNHKKIHDLCRFHGKTLQVTGLNIVRTPDGIDKLAIPGDRLNRYRAILHQLRANPPADPEQMKKERDRLRGIINYVALVYGRNMPSLIKKPYLACKETFGIQDREPRKKHFNMYPDEIDLTIDLEDDDDDSETNE